MEMNYLSTSLQMRWDVSFIQKHHRILQGLWYYFLNQETL